MIKMYTAFTSQIDDPKAAAKEILEQLEPEKNMRKNTVGIAAFYHEYAENGAYRAVAAALPFDLVGSGTTFTGACGQTGEYSLVVAMLTSDDVSFGIFSQKIENKSRAEIREGLKKMYGEVLARGKPKLVLSYMSTQSNFSGDDLVDDTNAISDDLLLFGVLGWSADANSLKNYVAFKENTSPYLMSFVAVYGDFEPHFRVVVSMDYKALIKEAASITSSAGPILRTVNGIPALDYLKKIGIVGDSEVMLYAIPAVVIDETGARTARAIIQTAPDDPKSLFGVGNFPTGAKISFALMNAEETIRTAVELTKEYGQTGVQKSLNYSCAARSWSMGNRFLAEGEAFAAYHGEAAKNGVRVDYILGYAGGEICPVPDKDWKLVNRLHNYTLISCSFD